MKKVLICVLLLNTAIYHGSELKEVSFEQIFLNKGERLFKPLPRLWGWADDSSYYELKEGKLYKVTVKNQKSHLVLDPARYPELLRQKFQLFAAVHRTGNLSRFLFLKKGDIFLFDREKVLLRQITDTVPPEYNPTFSPDGEKIAFTRAGDLYVHNINEGKTVRFTRDGGEEVLNGYASWVYYEEILGRRSRYKAFWWAPDSRKIVFMRFDQKNVPVFPILDSRGVYSSVEKQRYPKPGYPNPVVRIGIADLNASTVRWIPCQDESDHYLAFPLWDQQGASIYFQWMNRRQNRLKLLVYRLDSGKTGLVYEEAQPAWIEFLGDLGLKDLYILENGDVLLKSSKSGWYHLQYVSRRGAVRAVTAGEWSVHQIEHVDEAAKIIYFTARKEDSTELDLYKTDFSGSTVEKLTAFKGTHSVRVSPGGRFFFDWYSAVSTPHRVELRDDSGHLVRILGDSYSPVIKNYLWGKVELFRFTTADGYRLPVLWYLPPNFDPAHKYPVVFTIYGGPGTPSVMNSYRLSPHFLAQQGIIVLAVDHRGSGHFGKKGMDTMHLQLGRWEIHDYCQVVGYLRSRSFVDPRRIGITGASYGGYLTALALTRGADCFRYGYADSGVYDWKLYDSIYTERYMGTPRTNMEGYRKSSVSHYMDRFTGTLRLTHGTLDDNGHVQSLLQLLDRSLDAGKMLELELYPGERHVYRGRKNIAHLKSSLNFWLRNYFSRTLNLE